MLRRAGVSVTGMLKVYLSVIRPILEYAVPVWQSICEMQSEKLESIQRRALNVILPTVETYKDALNSAGLEILTSRRTHLCGKIYEQNEMLHSSTKYVVTIEIIDIE